MTVRRTRLLVAAGLLVPLVIVALVCASIAQAHRPNKGIAAAYFSAATYSMCSPSTRCDVYGLARCWNWGPNSVKCARRATDFRGLLHVRHSCTAEGIVDHQYRVIQRKQRCY